MKDDKRKHTFDAYHAERVSGRENLVRRALELLSTGRYRTFTELAKDVAKIVTELETRQVKDGEESPKKMAYTTLVRKNSKYKHILLAHFNNTSEDAKSDDEEELEELRLHCAHLEHDNELLRHRLSTIGSRKGVEVELNSGEGGINPGDIRILIDLIDGFVSHAPGIFDQIGPNDTDEDHPIPGLYGPDGLLADYETLQRIDELRNELKKYVR